METTDAPAANSELPSNYITTYSFSEVFANEGLMKALDEGSEIAFKEDYGEQGTAVPYSELIDGKEGIVTILREGNVIVGAGATRYYQDGAIEVGTKASQELTHAYVLPEYRHKGYGTILTRARIEECIKHGGNTWSILSRGEEQLKMYREMMKEEATKAGKTMTDWEGDPTTQSYAYAYLEKKDTDKALIIFQGRTPNSNSVYRSATIDLNPKLAPDNLKQDGHLGDFTQRGKDRGGLSKAVTITSNEFDGLQKIVEQDYQLEDLKVIDGGFPQVLSVTVE